MTKSKENTKVEPLKLSDGFERIYKAITADPAIIETVNASGKFKKIFQAKGKKIVYVPLKKDLKLVHKIANGKARPSDWELRTAYTLLNRMFGVTIPVKPCVNAVKLITLKDIITAYIDAANKQTKASISGTEQP